MIFLSVSASSSEPPGSWGVSGSDGGGGILRSKLPGNGGKSKPLGGTGGMIVGVVGCEGVLTVGDGVLGGGGAVGAVKGGRGEGGRGEKNPGGGIPGGMAGKLMVSGAGGKGGANFGAGRRGTGAIENGVNRVLDDFGGMVCGRRPASAGVSSIKPTEPGIFFEEFPP